MFQRHIIAACLSASVAIVPVTRVEADAGDFVAGAIVGAIGNGAARQNAQRRTTTVVRQPTARPRIPSTREGREIQASLNYFTCNAGTVDGQLGQRSRDAIPAYQGYMGYPMTGQLSSFEQSLLLSSHNRAQAGGFNGDRGRGRRQHRRLRPRPARAGRTAAACRFRRSRGRCRCSAAVRGGAATHDAADAGDSQ